MLSITGNPLTDLQRVYWNKPKVPLDQHSFSKTILVLFTCCFERVCLLLQIVSNAYTYTYQTEIEQKLCSQLK